MAPAALAALQAPIVEAYRERLATRHPGHHDAERRYEDR